MSNNGKSVRTLPWLRARSRLALESEFRDVLVSLASRLKPSGTKEAAREKMFLETGDASKADELAKSCRWLAVIRRDHGPEVFELVINSPIETPTPNKHGQERSMKNGRTERGKRTRQSRRG